MTTPTRVRARKPSPSEGNGDGWDEYLTLDSDAPLTPTETVETVAPTQGSSDIWSHPKLQGFLSFVEMKIKEMEEYARISRNFNTLTFDEVNSALGKHYTTFLSLLSLYNIAVVEMEREKARFQEWFDEKYISVRKRENHPSLSAQKWLSQKEIEAMVRVENKGKFREGSAAVLASERQVAFLRRLVDSWESHKFALQTMSKNLQTEFNSAHMSDNSGDAF